ncbi:MAG: heme-binding protein [Phycisphaerales bacterium]|jgi:uncharacterized protein GlcG (DUF336 family)
MHIDSIVSQEMIAAASAQACALGAAVSVAVVDSGGALLAFLRMDGAELAGPVLAVDKAYTSVLHRESTQELSTLAAPGGPLFGLHSNGGGRFVIFGGGIPIIHGDVVIGGIGVSGGSVEEDIVCASAGATRAAHLLLGAPEPGSAGV